MHMQTLIKGLSDAERLAMMQRLAAGSLTVVEAVAEMETTTPVGTNALYAGGKAAVAAAAAAAARAETTGVSGAAAATATTLAAASASAMTVALSPLHAVSDRSVRRALDSSAWEMGTHCVSVHTAEGVPSAVGGEARRARLAAALRIWRSGAAARRSDLAQRYQDSSFFAPLVPGLFGLGAYGGDAATAAAADEEEEAAKKEDAGSDADGDAEVEVPVGAKGGDEAAAEAARESERRRSSLRGAPARVSSEAPDSGSGGNGGGNGSGGGGGGGGALPPGWLEHISEAGLPYYHSALERRTTWTRPRGAAAVVAAAEAAAADAAGGGDSVGAASASSAAADRRAPLAAGWEAFVTEEGMPYYYNALARKTTWLKPSARSEPPLGARGAEEEEEAGSASASAPSHHHHHHRGEGECDGDEAETSSSDWSSDGDGDGDGWGVPVKWSDRTLSNLDAMLESGDRFDPSQGASPRPSRAGAGAAPSAASPRGGGGGDSPRDGPSPRSPRLSAAAPLCSASPTPLRRRKSIVDSVKLSKKSTAAMLGERSAPAKEQRAVGVGGESSALDVED